jgi:hypothetical protein
MLAERRERVGHDFVATCIMHKLWINERRERFGERRNRGEPRLGIFGEAAKDDGLELGAHVLP